MSSDWTQLWETFHRIREADPPVREFYLSTLNDSLRREILELLNAESDAGQMLEGLVGEEMAQLVERADVALYASKSAGRDCVSGHAMATA